MNEEELHKLKLHIAGATVRHKSPFDKLISYKNEITIGQKFRDEWVIPYYFELNRTDEEWIKLLIDLKPTITDEVILKNLGDFNWRTRSTGAFLPQ